VGVVLGIVLFMSAIINFANGNIIIGIVALILAGASISA